MGTCAWRVKVKQKTCYSTLAALQRTACRLEHAYVFRALQLRAASKHLGLMGNSGCDGYRTLEEVLREFNPAFAVPFGSCILIHVYSVEDIKLASNTEKTVTNKKNA